MKSTHEDSGKGRRGLLFIMKILLIAAIIPFALLVGIWFHPPLVLSVPAIIGRGSLCSIVEAWRGTQKRYQLSKQLKSVEPECRLVERDGSGYELWQTPLGRYWVPEGSAGSLPMLVAQQMIDIYEVQDSDGQVVLDCGAHIGLYARKVLDAGARLVVAIEPAPSNLECLRRNLRDAISDGRAMIYPKGVWDREELLPLYEDPENSAADSFIAGGERSVVRSHIPLTTIDLLVAELEVETVDVIKMDIKGAARRALLGAQETLRRHKPVLAVSVEELEDDFSDIKSLITGLSPGYQTGCGICSTPDKWRIKPEVLFAR